MQDAFLRFPGQFIWGTTISAAFAAIHAAELTVE
jgi:hypothetical protein